MRTLILSDIHGNLEALQAVLHAAPEHDSVWNLGDVVGYGASPNEVVDLLRPLANANVRGNHDKACCGITPPTSFNPSARLAAEWTLQELREDTAKWLQELPKGPLTPEGSDSWISHGSPVDEDQYILNIRDAWEPLQQMRHRITFFGHTHVQGGFESLNSGWMAVKPVHPNPSGFSRWTLPLKNDGTRYLLNPGSVGQPRDGDWRAAFAILDRLANQITFYRQPYDVTVAQGKILMAGLPDRLAQRLREGH